METALMQERSTGYAASMRRPFAIIFAASCFAFVACWPDPIAPAPATSDASAPVHDSGVAPPGDPDADYVEWDSGVDSGAPNDGGSTDSGIANDAGAVCATTVTASVGRREGGFFLPWVRTPTGFAAVSIEDGGATIHFFNDGLAEVGTGVSLPAPDPRTTLVFASDDSLIVTWQETAADGGETLFATRARSDGGVGFDAGNVTIERPGPAPGLLSAIPSNDGSCILLVWDNSCSGFIWHAMTIDREGHALSTPHAFTPMPGGPACGFSAERNFVPFGQSGFAYVSRGPNNSTTQTTAFVHSLDCALNEDVSAGREYVLPGVPTPGLMQIVNLRAMKQIRADAGDELWALVQPLGPSHLFSVRALGDGGEPTLDVDAGAANVFSASLLNAADGSAYVVWPATSATGTTWFTQRLGDAQPSILATSGTERQPVWTPPALSGPTGTFAYASLVDAGSGELLDAQLTLTCEPP